MNGADKPNCSLEITNVPAVFAPAGSVRAEVRAFEYLMMSFKSHIESLVQMLSFLVRDNLYFHSRRNRRQDGPGLRRPSGYCDEVLLKIR